MNLIKLTVDEITNEDSFCNSTFLWINLCQINIKYRAKFVDKPQKDKELNVFDWINTTTFELLMLNKEMLMEKYDSKNEIHPLFVQELNLYKDVISKQLGENKDTDKDLDLKISICINLVLGNISQSASLWNTIVKQYDSYTLKEKLIKDIGSEDKIQKKKMKI
jgi:hypothetical protein